MATPQEFVPSCEKKQKILKLIFPFFLTYVAECVSWRKTKQLWCILFVIYSKIFNLFSEERIPLTLLEIKLPAVLEITSFINRQ